jgi:RNA polymerase sigma factor for flagellar operon FliA
MKKINFLIWHLRKNFLNNFNALFFEIFDNFNGLCGTDTALSLQCLGLSQNIFFDKMKKGEKMGQTAASMAEKKAKPISTIQEGAIQLPPQKEDLSERNALIEQYLPYATSIANKIAHTLSSDADLDEIICNARLGLLEAAKRYDPKYNVDFKTFAYYRIKGAIYDGLRKTGWIPRSLYAKIKFEQASNEYLQAMSDRASGARRVNPEEETKEIYEAVNSLASIYIISIDASEETMDFEDKKANDIERKTEFHKIKEYMREAIEELPEKERKLVKMYYFQNKTLEEAGTKLSLSKSWTSRLHARALELLFKKMSQIQLKLAHQNEES